MPKRSAVAALTTASALVAAALAAPSASAAASPKALPNSVPSWTHTAHSLGAATSGAVVDARVYLAPRGGFDKLSRDAMAVSTPGSTSYHKFLTAAQYHAAYDPSAATVSAVKGWLSGNGLKVTGVAAYNNFLTVRGTVAAAEKAFGTSIGRFSKAGHVYQAPTTTLHAPASLAGSVLTVTGLDTAPKFAKPLHSAEVAPPAGFRNARPCSKYYGQITAKFQADFKTKLPKFDGQYVPYAVCGYTGPFFRAAYEGNLGVYGSGATVGIVDAYAAPTIAYDANRYAQRNGDGSYASGQLQQFVNRPFRAQKLCGPSGWAGEETLDVEAVHAMAPAANIRYYGARSCYNTDLEDAVARAVNDDKVQVISNSYGGPEESETTSDVRAEEKVLLQAAMQGISVLFSSGDSGDFLAETGTRQAGYPASDPYATGVGGTSTAIGGNGGLLFQTGWGTHKFSLSSDGTSWDALGFLYGAGGGASALFNRPSYQDGVVRSAYRMEPDVAMDADPTTGMLIGETQQFPGGTYYDEYRIGGTSLASPLLAGLTALGIGARGGKPAGFLNPLIYRNTSAFYDVKDSPSDPGNVRVDYANGVNGNDGLVYSVRTFNQDSSLHVSSGYDDVTGVGVPKPSWVSVVASS